MRRFFVSLVVLALVSASGGTIKAGESAAEAATNNDATAALRAMRWFTEMMAGRTDRSLYSPAFAPQVTEQGVAKISHDLNRYGAAPLRAEVIRSKKEPDQTFYEVEFVFPRGDATSVLFGFDAQGKITGVAPLALAGD